jgi:isopentenyl-diphosphate delta-isomerase
MSQEEYVVLVDEQNKPIGKALKSVIHTKNTPLHRGFSVFLFNSKKQLLLQQRSSTKKTWPLVWSNSCCGHPLPNESVLDAAYRRLDLELGLKPFQIKNLSIKIPDYRYRFERNGVTENEICPILVGFLEDSPILNPAEVENYKWIDWDSFLEIVKKGDTSFSEWSLEEASLLQKLNMKNPFLP